MVSIPMINEYDCSGHLGVCPTPEQLSRNKHQVVSDGMPYDAKKPLTCPHCIDLLNKFREDLCKKYGWDSWPF